MELHNENEAVDNLFEAPYLKQKQKQIRRTELFILIVIWREAFVVAWSSWKTMARSGFSSSQIPAQQDESIMTTLRVIMDVLKVCVQKKLNLHILLLEILQNLCSKSYLKIW